MQIQKCQLYNKIYKDLSSEGKEEKKKVKKVMKDSPSSILK